MPEQKRLSLAGIGCGSRTRTYMKLAMEQKDRYRIAAAADPVKQRTEAVRDFAPEEERDSIRLFKDAASLLEEPRLADPAFYIGNRLIEGGLPGVSAELDRISRENEGDGGGRVGIALRLDSAVSRALEQQLVDMVLAKGMTCYIAAEPAD